MSLRGLLVFDLYIQYSGLGETKFQIWREYIWFVMCGLASFREFWGLDMRFLGGKREKKCRSKSKGNRISRFAPSGFAPAFGRSVAAASQVTIYLTDYILVLP